MRFINLKSKLACKETAAVAFITLIGFLIRLAFLPDRFLTYDEAWTLALAKTEVDKIVTGSISAINLPLHFLLLHFWLKINQNPFFLRFSSVIFGTAMLPLIWFAGKRIFNSKVGILSCFLAAFSPAFIFESTNLRMYSLAILESLLAIYFFWRFIKTKSILFLSATGLIFLLGLYTHQYFSLLVLSLNFFLFSNFTKYRNLLLKWSLMQIVVFFFSLPLLWLSVTLPPIKLFPFLFSFWKIPSVFVVFAFSWDAIQILNLFPFKSLNFLNFLIFLFSSTLFITFLLGLKSLRDSRDLLNFFLICVFLPIIVVFLISIFFRPIFGVRSFIIFSPLYYLLAALGLSKLKQKNLTFTMIALLLMLSSFLANEYLGFKKTRSAIKPYGFVKNNSLPQDVFIHSDPYTLVLARVYLDDHQFAILPSWFSTITESAIGYNLIVPEEIPLKGNRFWYFLPETQYYNRDLANQKQREFEEKYRIIISQRFEEDKLRITLFDLGKK